MLSLRRLQCFMGHMKRSFFFFFFFVFFPHQRSGNSADHHQQEAALLYMMSSYAHSVLSSEVLFSPMKQGHSSLSKEDPYSCVRCLFEIVTCCIWLRFDLCGLYFFIVGCIFKKLSSSQAQQKGFSFLASRHYCFEYVLEEGWDNLVFCDCFGFVDNSALLQMLSPTLSHLCRS